MAALIVYLILGLGLAWRFLPGQPGAVKCWIGLVIGCAALMWLPCLAAFIWGFTKTAQYAALIAAGLGIAALAAEALLGGRLRLPGPSAAKLSGRDAVGLMLAGAATVFCGYLLYTHVLLPRDDGLWVGQSTYGDLAMHLGFIESLYVQGTFPPEYSIFPGQPLNYPFLADAASASLRFFGLSLRAAVIVPSLAMLLCVFWGFWLLADRLTGRLAPTMMSWLMFVANGGFGFILFCGKYRFSGIFTGFYTTPTNFAGEDIRWVNVICDMLIPQRATMAGWCVVLAAIYLLIAALDAAMAGRGRGEIVTLSVLAGALPMIHTHSFLALGILSAAWFFCLLPRAVRAGRIRRLITDYILYGVICLGLAAPQLLAWTMRSVASGNLLSLHLGWVAGENGQLRNWFLFFAMNVGVVFLAMWPMLPSLRGEALTMFAGAAAIFVLSNIVVFQPNLYDNNKLLYIWFMLTDILVCDWLWCIIEEAPRRPARGLLAGIIVFLGTFSGVLTMMREAVSEYRLLSAEQAAAAAFVQENTPEDSLFLTATNHNNPIPVLTGRSIVCGSRLYLFFHGVDYQQREARLPAMYAGGAAFERAAVELGIDYVYIGDYEYADYDVNYDWFAENYPLVYDEGGISIFEITN